MSAKNGCLIKMPCGPGCEEKILVGKLLLDEDDIIKNAKKLSADLGSFFKVNTIYSIDI